MARPVVALAVAVMALGTVARRAAADGDASPPAANIRQMMGRWYAEEFWYWEGPRDSSCVVYDFSPGPEDADDVCLSMETFRSTGSSGAVGACFALNGTENRWHSKSGSAAMHLLDCEAADACTVRVGARGSYTVALLVRRHPPDPAADAVSALRRRQLTIDPEPPLRHVRHGVPDLCPPPRPPPPATRTEP